MAESEKKEIVYQYPTDNPHSGRGNQGVGYLEYRMPKACYTPFAVFMPIPESLEEAQELFGENCTPVWLFSKLVRGIGNDADNGIGQLAEAWKAEGMTDEEVANKIQEHFDTYEVAKPRASASAETKRKAAMVDEASKAGFSDAQIRAALAKLAEEEVPDNG